MAAGIDVLRTRCMLVVLVHITWTWMLAVESGADKLEDEDVLGLVDPLAAVSTPPGESFDSLDSSMAGMTKDGDNVVEDENAPRTEEEEESEEEDEEDESLEQDGVMADSRILDPPRVMTTNNRTLCILLVSLGRSGSTLVGELLRRSAPISSFILTGMFGFPSFSASKVT